METGPHYQTAEPRQVLMATWPLGLPLSVAVCDAPASVNLKLVYNVQLILPSCRGLKLQESTGNGLGNGVSTKNVLLL